MIYKTCIQQPNPRIDKCLLLSRMDRIFVIGLVKSLKHSIFEYIFICISDFYDSSLIYLTIFTYYWAFNMTKMYICIYKLYLHVAHAFIVRSVLFNPFVTVITEKWSYNVPGNKSCITAVVSLVPFWSCVVLDMKVPLMKISKWSIFPLPCTILIAMLSLVHPFLVIFKGFAGAVIIQQ